MSANAQGFEYIGEHADRRSAPSLPSDFKQSVFADDLIGKQDPSEGLGAKQDFEEYIRAIASGEIIPMSNTQGDNI